MHQITRELERFLALFGEGEISFSFLGDDEPIASFIRLLSGNILPEDSPGFIISRGEQALILEHFGFDSFPRSRKGSEARMKDACIKKESCRQVCLNGEAVLFGELLGNPSYEHYINNAIVNFRQHYEKIGQYRNNVASRCTATGIATAFWMDDVSPLGSPRLRSDGSYVDLMTDKRFLDFLKDRPEVDYVIISYADILMRRVSLIPLISLDEYRKHQKSYLEEDTFCSIPKTIDIGKMFN